MGDEGSWEKPVGGTHLAVTGSPGICARSWEGNFGHSLHLGSDGRAPPSPGTQGQDKASRGCSLAPLPHPSPSAHTHTNEHTRTRSPSLPLCSSLFSPQSRCWCNDHDCHEAGLLNSLPPPLPSPPCRYCAITVLSYWLVNLSLPSAKLQVS